MNQEEEEEEDTEDEDSSIHLKEPTISEVLNVMATMKDYFIAKGMVPELKTMQSLDNSFIQRCKAKSRARLKTFLKDCDFYFLNL